MQCNHPPLLVLTLALTLGLAACQPQNAGPGKTQATATPGASAPQTLPATMPAESRLISLEPASMSTCVPAEVVAKWDVRAKHADITGIEIWVGSGTESKVWIASSPYGEATTGPWIAPGSVFILKNQATGGELARTVMQGPTCR